MRLHRFYVATPISSDTFDISDRDLVHQWKSVFRYNVGSQVILFDGNGVDCLALITSLRNLGATVEIFEKKNNRNKMKINLTLCLALIKKDNFELVVEKATELGVSQIIPVLCERSEKKKVNIERLQKIAIEASEQSGRSDVPKIFDVITLSDLLDSVFLPQDKILLHPTGEKPARLASPARQEVASGGQLEAGGLKVESYKETQNLAVFIGPEGGFSDREIKEFAEHNILSVSLGQQILRVETASIAVASLLLL